MNWQYILGFLYIIFSIWIWYLFPSTKSQPEFISPNAGYLKTNSTNDIKVTYEPKMIGFVTKDFIEIIVLISLVISALLAIMNASILNQSYNTLVESRTNWIRWTDYALTGGLMFIAISLILGVTDLFYIILSTACFIIISLQGGVLETYINAEKFNEMIFPAGIVILLSVIIIGVLIFFFVEKVNAIRKAGYQTPEWMYWLIVVSILFFLSFGGIMLAYIYIVYRRNINYRYFDIMYSLIALVGKVALSFIIIYGLSQSNIKNN